MHGHFRDAEVAVIVEEATAAGISVMSHAYSPDGIKVAVRNGVRSIEHGNFLDDEAISMMAFKGVTEAGAAGTRLPEHIVEKNLVLLDNQIDSVRRAVAAGVRIAFGTDTGVTAHGRNLEELALLVECGLTPEQALHAATLSAAELMGMDAELGSIEPGKRADLVVVDGDTRDVASLASRIVSVHQDGNLVHTRPRNAALSEMGA